METKLDFTKKPSTIDVDALAGRHVLVDFGDGRTVLLTNDQARQLSRELRRAANEPERNQALTGTKLKLVSGLVLLECDACGARLAVEPRQVDLTTTGASDVVCEKCGGPMVQVER